MTRLPTPGTSAELDEHVTSYATAEDRSLLHGGALIFFDGPLERLDVVRAAARAVLAHDELRHKPTTLPFAADVLAWPLDTGFRASRQVQVVEIDDARDERALARAAARVWSRALPGDRPPWELTLFCGRGAERAAVLLKAHRELIEACGAAALAAILLGTVDPGVPRLRPTRSAPGGVLPALLQVAGSLADQGARRSRALASEVRAMLRPGVALARTREVGRILESAGTLLSSPAPETPWNGTLGPERRVAWLALSRDVLRGVEEMFGGTWQDAWLTIVADALGRYLRSRGRATLGLKLLAYLPATPAGVHTPHEPARLVALPADEMAPAKRYEAVLQGRAEELSAARGGGLEQLARLSQRLPAPLQSVLGSLCYQAANTVLVADPEPSAPLVVGERTATSLVPLAPLPWHVGLALAALAWRDDEISVGVTADALLVPHVGAFLPLVHDAYVELAAAAGVPPLDPARLRRAPRPR